MKKGIIIMFVSLLVLPISVFSASYEIKDQNVTIELDDNWVVFTRDNISGNEKLAEMGKRETIKCLNNVLLEASKQMKNNYNRADN